ncbi:MAG: 2-C-methyl-D-erythritol 4-phosphate cytidylyltransferase [Cycloclasticus sp.]
MKNNTEKTWCVVPAAGLGSRMQQDRPKQYLAFRSSTILDVTLSRLLACQQFEKIVLCLRSDDPYWPSSQYFTDERIIVAVGGDERADSVLNGIQALKAYAGQTDWVLVHDAARPCIRLDDIERLISSAKSQQQGAILAAPIHDTIKYVSANIALKTLDRSSLWRALTPQIFKLDDLEQALLSAKLKGSVITDEASAIEQLNQVVLIVEGRADNIKITCPDDLALADFYIEKQEKEKCE